MTHPMILQVITLLLPVVDVAHARPEDLTGAHSFDRSDEIATLDSATGSVRVWYSVSGPNVALLEDADADGVPDFPALVASTAEAVLAFYSGLGLRPPVSDGSLGGDGAVDAYLLDFAGIGDGQFVSERCTDVGGASQCYGYFAMENDFSGYGYSDLGHAVRTLTSHELFHAVQAAYDAGEESWWSEGSATWGEWAFDPGNTDFLYLCDAYLADPSRSLDQPPSGLSSFSYGTALWWTFLTQRFGDDILADLLLATESGSSFRDDMAAVLTANGGDLGVEWAEFARWNLATGPRAGLMESYSFAASIGPPTAEARDRSWADDYRFYPLASTYVEIQHRGGPLRFALAEEAPNLAFSLHAEADEGALEPALDTWAGSLGVREFGELPEGSYWLVASNPTLDEDSTKVLVCLGSDDEAVEPCLSALEAMEDSGGPGDSAAATPHSQSAKPPEGCGCGTDAGGAARLWVLVAGLSGLLLLRRRPSRGG